MTRQSLRLVRHWEVLRRQSLPLPGHQEQLPKLLVIPATKHHFLGLPRHQGRWSLTATVPQCPRGTPAKRCSPRLPGYTVPQFLTSVIRHHSLQLRHRFPQSVIPAVERQCPRLPRYQLPPQSQIRAKSSKNWNRSSASSAAPWSALGTINLIALSFVYNCTLVPQLGSWVQLQVGSLSSVPLIRSMHTNVLWLIKVAAFVDENFRTRIKFLDNFFATALNSGGGGNCFLLSSALSTMRLKWTFYLLTYLLSHWLARQTCVERQARGVDSLAGKDGGWGVLFCVSCVRCVDCVCCVHCVQTVGRGWYGGWRRRNRRNGELGGKSRWNAGRPSIRLRLHGLSVTHCSEF